MSRPTANDIPLLNLGYIHPSPAGVCFNVTEQSKKGVLHW